jgi:endonuclease/exonuclease/phosphatase family metal-dependent hydrolase
MATYRRITKLVFLALNIVAVVAFILACMAPHLNPQKWWVISLIGLGFAFIMVTLIAFMFFWLVFRPRYIFLSLVPMIIGWKSIAVFFAFHIPDNFSYVKKPGTLRLVHWNVARFTEWKKNNNKGSRNRLRMMDLIKEQQADVLCLQEFYTSTDPVYYNNIKYIMKELGYAYYYYSWDLVATRQWVGQAIFSRLPLLDSGLVRFSKPSMPESLIYADVALNEDTIRIYTTHLQSVRFRKKDYETIENIKKTDTDEETVENSKSIFTKLKRGVIYRSSQSEQVKQTINTSPHPFILTGDFNDVPNSYTYFTIRGKELQDAFLATGMGVGKTYSYIAPTLRIDYMLTTKDLEVKQFNRIIKEYSDHYMLVADFALRKK